MATLNVASSLEQLVTSDADPFVRRKRGMGAWSKIGQASSRAALTTADE